MKEDKVFTEEELAEINALFQEAADEDMEGVVEDPYPPLEPPLEPEGYREDWEEYKSRLPEYGPPEDLKEEV